MAAKSAIGTATNTKSSKKPKLAKNLSKVVILSCFLDIYGEIPFSVGFIVFKFATRSEIITLIYFIASYNLLLAFSLDFFIYYGFNRRFRTTFNRLFFNLKSSNVTQK